MRVVNVEAREVHVHMDFALSDLVKIRHILDMAVLNYNSQKEDDVEAMAVFKEFYGTIEKLTEGVPNAD